MAERINPPSHAEPRAADIEGLEPERRADPAFSGSKSIKSAPGSVSGDIEVTAKGDESVRDSILKELRRLTRAEGVSNDYRFRTKLWAASSCSHGAAFTRLAGSCVNF